MNSDALPSSSYKNLLPLLDSRFGFQEFRPHQEEVCQNLVQGRDILLVMPTGAGKSLCYQVPGIALGGTTIVISPLLALIEDQVEKLVSKKIRADRIHSGRSREDSRNVCMNYLAGKIEFLFIAPERLSLPGFIDLIKKRPPTLIAIDEAHCISQWGHDFRPDYRLLGERLQDLRPAPILAMTASATPLVQDDICNQLRVNNALKLIHGFRRTNIAIQIMDVPPKKRMDYIRVILKNKDRTPAIIYAPTRKNAEMLHAELCKDHLVGIYHAGLRGDEREKSQRLFLENKIDIMVSTVAFGMGIDKPNVRTVIHAALPGSVEGYYQEIGRAGRDGNPSQAVLLQSYSDYKTHEFFFTRDYPELEVLEKIYQQLTTHKIPKDTLRKIFRELEDVIFEKSLEKLWIHHGALIDYDDQVAKGIQGWAKTYEEQRTHKQKQVFQLLDFAQTHMCRMLALVKHFGDQNDSGEPCGICDNCKPQNFSFQNQRAISLAEQATVKELLGHLNKKGAKAAGRLFEEISNANKPDKRQEFEKILLAIVRVKWVQISEESFLKEGKEFSYRKISISQLGKSANQELISQLKIDEIQKSSKKSRNPKPAKIKSTVTKADVNDSPLFEALRSWRRLEAKEKGVPAFRILSDKMLLGICEALPKDEGELLKLHGMGPKLSQLYGDDLLEIVQDHIH